VEDEEVHEWLWLLFRVHEKSFLLMQGAIGSKYLMDFWGAGVEANIALRLAVLSAPCTSTRGGISHA
jgi:hypothetical protein